MDEPKLPTAITRDNAALVLIDLQATPLGSVQSIDQRELAANAGALAHVGQLLGLPTILAHAPFSGAGAAFLPEIEARVREPIRIAHATNNAWETPAFVEAVKQTGRTHLVMAGIATDVGLGLAAMSAAAAGYAVYSVVDASGTLNAHIEQAAWLRMAHAGVALVSWTGITGEIQRRYADAPGPQLLALIRERLDA